MMTVYSAPNTRAIRVIWVLQEIGAKAEIRSMPYPPRQHAPDYFAVNPTGMVPLLIDGEVRLGESMAICDYLATKHGSPLVVPTDDPERPQFLQWLWYGESTLMTPLSRLNIVRRVEHKTPEVDALIAGARDHVAERLEMLEERLEGREFLAAGRLTLADVSVSYPLHLVGMLGLDNLLGPRAVAYHERLRARPAYQRALAVA
ncbi:glutathione S-transferase family protein [Reyranella soli]|uniref:Glutathione S-transferase n=1 Tax=Reyranella soli TaxID=1230389 RepID=A0A512N4G0_9HYPH|nr:glutathione S-transferase family protein [Reyranella soli]GEP53866.1 glutathione S-transferase [Reyranella soli]